jgi:hypothetical protein
MMPLQGSLSIERMCQLAQVSRASFYRYLQGRAPVEEDMEVRSTIQAIAVEHRRRYGYRRITAELRRRGMLVSPRSTENPRRVKWRPKRGCLESQQTTRLDNTDPPRSANVTTGMRAGQVLTRLPQPTAPALIQQLGRNLADKRLWIIL